MATKKAAAKKAAPKKVTPPPPTKKVAAPKSNIVVVDFSEDSKELLKGLISAITSAFAPVIAQAPVAAQPAQQQTKQVLQADLFPPIKKEEPVVKTDEAVTLTMIREQINIKADKEGKTAEIVALLGKFHAQNASSLDPENYTMFYNELTHL